MWTGHIYLYIVSMTKKKRWLFLQQVTEQGRFGKKRFTFRRQWIPPVLQQCGDVSDELTIEWICEDVLKTLIFKQALRIDWRQSMLKTLCIRIFLHVITLIWSKGAEFKGKLFNLFSNLLNAQAQVVDAVGFIRLAVRPADLLDETTQTKTEICRSALQQIHLHSHGALWIRHSGRRKSC